MTGSIASWIAATSVALVASAAAAQPTSIDSIDQTQVIERINEDSVVPALKVVTGNHIGSVDAEGAPSLSATATNGLRFDVNFRACEEASEDAARHCMGLFMVSAWDPVPAGQEDAWTSALVQYLRDNPSVSAGRTEDGSPFVVRYVIADFGTKQGNLVSEFANFIRSATAFQNAIAPIYSHK